MMSWKDLSLKIVDFHAWTGQPRKCRILRAGLVQPQKMQNLRWKAPPLKNCRISRAATFHRSNAGSRARQRSCAQKLRNPRAGPSTAQCRILGSRPPLRNCRITRGNIPSLRNAESHAEAVTLEIAESHARNVPPPIKGVSRVGSPPPRNCNFHVLELSTATNTE